MFVEEWAVVFGFWLWICPLKMMRVLLYTQHGCDHEDSLFGCLYRMQR
jgi:hypothetical protein